MKSWFLCKRLSSALSTTMLMSCLHLSLCILITRASAVIFSFYKSLILPAPSEFGVCSAEKYSFSSCFRSPYAASPTPSTISVSTCFRCPKSLIDFSFTRFSMPFLTRSNSAHLSPTSTLSFVLSLFLQLHVLDPTYFPDHTTFPCIAY